MGSASIPPSLIAQRSSACCASSMSCEKKKGKIYTALLFRTDTDCAALDILRYYRVRFQIEFLFRDAKQHTGLCDCQATSEEKLGFHFNVSLAALNLLRLEDRQQALEGAGRNVISIANWKTRKFNAHLLERFLAT